MGQVALVLFVVRFVFAFFRDRRSDNARRCWFPNQSLPFICFAEELKGSEWVAGIPLDAQYFGNHL